MTSPRIECAIRLTGPRSRPVVRLAGPPLSAGRVPRIARLMALAHKLDGLLGQGAIRNYAALARLGHVSRARISQIMNLLWLAPDIQEQLLWLPLTGRGRDAIRLGHLQAIAQTLDWQRQRACWRQLRAAQNPGFLGEFPGGSYPAEVTDIGSATAP
jgi:hypothetical protein